MISREIALNSGPDGTYYGSVADILSAVRVRRPKPFKLTENEPMCRRIEPWMDDSYSPRLIALELAQESGGYKTRQVSRETIYQALYVQTRGNLRADLAQKLSLKRRQRISRTGTRRGGNSPFDEAGRTLRDSVAYSSADSSVAMQCHSTRAVLGDGVKSTVIVRDLSCQETVWPRSHGR